MPLYKTISNQAITTVKIWKITESFAELMAPLDLKPESLERVQGMKSDIHKRGFLSVRHLLREFGYTDQDLSYDERGKPHLKDGKHISISHSFSFSGVIISDHPVGIDIEMQRPKIARIAHKFVDYEAGYLNVEEEDYVKKLTVIWAIKEALYKLFATAGMIFKDHFLVIPFGLDHQYTAAWIDYKGLKQKHQCAFVEFEQFTCAYTV